MVPVRSIAYTSEIVGTVLGAALGLLANLLLVGLSFPTSCVFKHPLLIGLGCLEEQAVVPGSLAPPPPPPCSPPLPHQHPHLRRSARPLEADGSGSGSDGPDHHVFVDQGL